MKTKHLLLDSCILNDLATDPKTQSILENAAKYYNFVYSAVSLLEVGFGPESKRDDNQHQLARKIYSSNDILHLDNDAAQIHEYRNLPFPPGSIYLWVPARHEWFAARHSLISLMDAEEIGGRRARELGNDAIIFASAYNSGSTIITNNVKDFVKFNKIMCGDLKKHVLPIFDIEDLGRSFTEDVIFPNNLQGKL
ncbi:type II toxin-antitoxin system VapC family toxin [Burkholderia sp. 3C]